MQTRESEANTEYGKQREAAIDKLDEIRRLICEVSDANQNRTPENWTHAGSMGHINEELDGIINFIS